MASYLNGYATSSIVRVYEEMLEIGRKALAEQTRCTEDAQSVCRQAVDTAKEAFLSCKDLRAQLQAEREHADKLAEAIRLGFKEQRVRALASHQKRRNQ